MPDTRYTPTDNPILTGIMGRCPQCQRGKLFDGFLKLAPRCEVCGLDYSFADPADGPAFFAMTFGCVPPLAFAVWLQATFDPPVWIHAVTTMPLLVLCCVAVLRPLKGWLVCSQYFHRAEQGSIDHEYHARRKVERESGNEPGGNA